MIVSIVGSSCYVYREDGDPIFRPNRSVLSWSAPGWHGAESRLLHHVKRILNQRGYDLIKKRMWRDGHLFGSDETQYLRSRDLKMIPSLQVYHSNYATEIAAELFNKLGMVELTVGYGLTEEGDCPLAVDSWDYVRAIEEFLPCYEVSWSAPADLDSGLMTSAPGQYRNFKGFTDLSDAIECFDCCSGEYPKIIDRRTGDQIIP